MSRRLAIGLALVALGVSFWLLRGGRKEEAGRELASRPMQPPESRKGGSAPAASFGSRDSSAPADAAPGPMALGRDRSKPMDAPPPPAKLGSGPSKPFGMAKAMVERETEPEKRDKKAGPEDLEETIRNVTQNPDPTERASAVGDLLLQDDLTTIIPVLRSAAADPDPEVRMAVVSALGQYEEDLPTDVVATLASDPDPAVRLEVLDLLSLVADQDELRQFARSTIQQAMRDPDLEVREKATDAEESLAVDD